MTFKFYSPYIISLDDLYLQNNLYQEGIEMEGLKRKIYSSLNNKKDKSGFTLIELMIVCVIISIIALIVVPFFLRSVAKKKQSSISSHLEKSSQIEKLEELPYRIEPKGTVPVFSEEDIKIHLSIDHHRIGMDVYNRFESDFKGSFSFLPLENKKDPIRLDFKFPLGTTEAKDVSLKFISESGSYEPQNVIYDREGIFWIGIINENKPLKAEISFIAHGRNRFEYELPPAFRSENLNIELEMEEGPEYFIPDGALQPTSTEINHIVWEFNNLVTDRAIIVDFPEAQSPVGRVLFLCKLVGLAVLFFGIGFWYLAALYRIEGLASFRWAHFLLLALTYSLFFVIFGILGFRGNLSTWTAIGISAALSLPLLTLHVSRIIDMKFSLTRNLPFSIFTLAMVINGVYGGEARDYIFIISIFIVVAFLTITFKKWASNRETWIDGLLEELDKKIKDFNKVVKEAKEINKKANKVINEGLPFEDEETIKELKELSKHLIHRINEYDEILIDLSKLKSQKYTSDSQYLRESMKSKISYQFPNLMRGKNSLEVSIENILGRNEKQKPEKTVQEGEIHCFSCGKCGGSTSFCPDCGTVRPKIIDCTCGENIKIPVHLINMEEIKQNNIYCAKCGKKHSLKTK